VRFIIDDIKAFGKVLLEAALLGGLGWLFLIIAFSIGGGR
jgi:hypothetical protein